jgi:FixJ family two-component response regulator
MSSTSPTYVAVVDDDPSVCRSFARLLRAAGIQPVTYASAEAFLADRKRPQFDCMVFDVQLGGMSGIQLATTLAAEGSRAPVIYITAHDDSETRLSAQATGCEAYFRKNDSGADVLEAIRRLTDGSATP